MNKLFCIVTLCIISGSASAAVTETCQKYFDETAAIFEKASQMGAQAKQQIDAMKPQMDAAKQQLEQYTSAQQDEGCKQGLAALVQLKTHLGIE